jgi:hypothetical protein
MIRGVDGSGLGITADISISLANSVAQLASAELSYRTKFHGFPLRPRQTATPLENIAS